MKSKTEFLLSTGCFAAMSAAALGWSAPAFAQDQVAAIDEAADSGDPIIVTAQRRAQRMQDVPIAITALGSEQLESQGITSTHDLAQGVTGMTITESGGYVQPFIRGVGSTVTNIGEQGSAATYVDGVYMPTINGQLYQLANVERIEVLKGPQGTLFGRNATTGAILITTRRPQFSPEGRFQIGYGSHNAVSLNGFMTGPLSSTVAVSVAGNYDSHDGYFNNLFTGEDNYGDAERYTLRGQVLIQPSSDFSITLSGDLMRMDDPGTILIQPINGYQGYMPGDLLPTDPYDYIGNEEVGYTSRQDGLSARLEWDAGGVTITSTTGYRWWTGGRSYDYDSDTTPIRYVAISNHDHGTSLTEELLLSSNNDGPFSWIVGGFYMRQFAQYDPLRIDVGANPPTLITAQQVTNAYAVFADGTYDLGDFEITAGIRYSYETKTYDGQVGGNPVVNDVSANWDSFTPRVVLAYHPNNDFLAYASYSRGFKSGTFNANALSSTPVNPETVDAFEVGLKITPFRGGVLNISAFHYEISDLQVQALNPATNLIEVANAAAVGSEGIDVEFVITAIDNLTLSFAASYLDATFTDFPNAQIYIPTGTGGNQSVIADVTGNRNVRSPEFTFNVAASYRIDLPNGGSIVPSANVYHSSSFFWEPGNRLREDPHTLVNANVTWNLPGDRFSITAWVQNLTNEVHYRNVSAAGQADRQGADAPRTYGVRLGYQF